jgi:hypothetical protein
MSAGLTCINIKLGANRDRTGYLSIHDDLGRILLGPFPVSARAADSIAAENGNPTREPVLPFGDPPTGRYKVVGVICTGQGTPYRGDLYGDAGAVVLAPISGDAALADACGRFQILIHGGRPAADGRLRVSSGNFRVFDGDLNVLMGVVKSGKGAVIADCTESAAPAPGELSLSLEDHETADASKPEVSFLPTPPFTPGHHQQIVAFGEYSPDEPDPGDVLKGHVEVDTHQESASIAEQIGKEFVDKARDLGLDTLNTWGGEFVPKVGIQWTEPASKLAGGLSGAAELYNNGQKDAAADAIKSTLVEVAPDIVATAAGTWVALQLPATVVAVAVGTAALGVTLPTAAIVVTSALVTVGVATAVSLGAKKFTDSCIHLIENHYKD